MILGIPFDFLSFLISVVEKSLGRSLPRKRPAYSRSLTTQGLPNCSSNRPCGLRPSSGLLRVVFLQRGSLLPEIASFSSFRANLQHHVLNEAFLVDSSYITSLTSSSLYQLSYATFFIASPPSETRLFMDWFIGMISLLSSEC